MVVVYRFFLCNLRIEFGNTLCKRVYIFFTIKLNTFNKQKLKNYLKSSIFLTGVKSFPTGSIGLL